MIKQIRPWGLWILLPFVTLSFLTGCDNSGYGMPDPYVITGTVSNGEIVEGTVHAQSFKRNDRYEAPIDANTGTYSLSITKPDPPYILWAEINGARTLHSYTPGTRNTDNPEDVKEQTVNINPITDMIMSLAYLEDTAERFSVEPGGHLPVLTEIDYFQSEMEKLFEDMFEDICLDEGFNLFHDDWSELIDSLFTSLTVTYLNNDDERAVILKGGSQSYYAYDFEEDKKTFSVDSDDAAHLIFLLTGIDPPCDNTKSLP
ncbi:MAG: hypothetical protein WC799_08720 [Desulfobacteraceae bacterium]|jgi:hypothetical protein